MLGRWGHLLCRQSANIRMNPLLLLLGVHLIVALSYTNAAPLNDTTTTTLKPPTNNVHGKKNQLDVSSETKKRINGAHKREAGMPDALVDDPEEFDETIEGNSEELPFGASAAAVRNARLLQDARFVDEPADYSYFTRNDRRKRTTRLGRSKRQLEIDPRLLRLMALLERNRYFSTPARYNPERWTGYEPQSEEMGINDGSYAEAEEADPSEYWPDPREDAPLFPVSKYSLPVYHRNIL